MTMADTAKPNAKPGAKICFSQFGEDMVLSHFLRHRDGFYVDVGCHHPYLLSNTAFFHLERGWRGINIDADPHAIDLFCKHRPGDINLNLGVGNERRILEFTRFKNRATNSFHAKTILHAQKQSEILDRIKIEVVPLREILADRLPGGVEIDYLNIDVEGLDEEVAISNDWSRFRPRYVSIEIHGLQLSKAAENPVVKLMITMGYRIRSQCVATTIFERL